MHLPRIVSAFVLLFSLTTFAVAQTARAGIPDKDLGRIIKIEVGEDGRPVAVSNRPIPPEAFSSEPVPPALFKPMTEMAAPEEAEKIHPVLRDRLSSHPGEESELVVVNFRDALQIPYLPDPVETERPDSPANQAIRAEIAERIEQIRGQRAQRNEARRRELAARHGAEVLETFWLTDAMLVRLPRHAVEAVAQRPDVLYVEPDDEGSPPPVGVDAGRAVISSDPYFNLGLTLGYIGLLDTGMRFTHTLLTSSWQNFGFQRDCNAGTATSCTGPDPTDDCWSHGTSSGAIITANANLGNTYRGVTNITLDSFKVYPSACGGLSTTAVLRAFQTAVAFGDSVIVAEMQGGGSDASSISTAGDGAYDSGAAVIAANGNFGPNPSTVNTPANAHKVIGIGAVDVTTLLLESYQSRGPAPDGRIKPDLQMPTNTTTASNSSDTGLQFFSGTSGATPYGGGMAALFRNWLQNAGASGTPGEIYAGMLVSGSNSTFDNNNGVGVGVMPTNSSYWTGSTSVAGTGATVDVLFTVTNGSAIDGAIWWPESVTQSHNDIDLRLVDPTGVERAWSLSISSVFERVRYTGALAAGTWTLRIYGYSVPTGPQTVFFAIDRSN